MGIKLLERASAALLVTLCISVLCATSAFAQVGRLERTTDWNYGPIGLTSGGGAPANALPVAPIIAQYNWGYGMTLLGLNLQVPGTNNYYAACASYANGNVQVLDAIGPLPTPVEWHAGGYHIAAGLSDGGLICVWLTAPGQYPSRVLVGGDYAHGTAFAVQTTPPNPLSADWNNWRIDLLYERVADARYLSLVRYNGNGRTLEFLTDAAIPGDILAIDLIEYPLTGSVTPYALLTISRNDTLPTGTTRYSTSYSAYYQPYQGWLVRALRDGGLTSTRVMLMNDGGVIGVMGVDNSTFEELSPGLQLVRTWADSGQVYTEAGPQGFLPIAAERQNLALVRSTLSGYPLVLVTNGTDVQMGYYPPGQPPGEFEYRYFPLYRGEVYSEGSLTRARYPIFALSVATHWSSGWPEAFWVQQDVAGSGRTSLYRMAYAP